SGAFRALGRLLVFGGATLGAVLRFVAGEGCASGLPAMTRASGFVPAMLASLVDGWGERGFSADERTRFASLAGSAFSAGAAGASVGDGAGPGSASAVVPVCGRANCTAQIRSAATTPTTPPQMAAIGNKNGRSGLAAGSGTGAGTAVSNA